MINSAGVRHDEGKFRLVVDDKRKEVRLFKILPRKSDQHIKCVEVWSFEKLVAAMQGKRIDTIS